MEAIDTKMANLICLPNGVCSPDCPLAHGHKVSPDFLRPQADGLEMATRVNVSSFNGSLRQTEVSIPGVHRSESLMELIESPAPVGGEQVACNALCALALARRGE